MKKAPAWSYSSITLFDQCPKKYYHLRVVKDIKEPESEAMLYGTAVHTAAEEYVRDGTPIPEQYKYMEPLLEKLMKIDGEKICELKMGIKKVDGKFAPCGFFDKDVWYRGIADLLKSSRYADPKQLALMAACVFVHYPEIEFVRAGLLFVVCKDFIPVDFPIHNKFDIFAKLDDALVSRETAYETGVFNPKKNFTCKAWCPVSECSHNGRN
jgi:hypothetical protein